MANTFSSSDTYMRSEMYMLVRADESQFTDGPPFATFADGLVGAQAGTTPFYVGVVAYVYLMMTIVLSLILRKLAKNTNH